MKTLITGSNGFVGRHLIKRMREDNLHYVLLQHRDFLRTQSLPECHYDLVIHLAGMAHVDDMGDASYDRFYQANCIYALDVARAAVKNGAKRFVYVSTIGVYGKSSSANGISESAELTPADFYSKSKLEAEKCLHRLSEEHGFELVIVRPALVYGHNAPGNIRRLLNLTAKFPLIPIAEKRNKRSFVYVENLVDFLLLSSTHLNAAGMVFNISDDAFSTRYLVDYLAKGMGKKPVLFAPPRALIKPLLKLIGKQKLYKQLFEDLVLDTSLAQQVLQWKPKHDSATAIMETGERFIVEYKERAQGDSQ